MKIRLNPALRAEQERVAARPRSHLLHFVAGDVVKKTGAVTAARHNAAPRGEIQPGGALAQCFVTLDHAYSLAVCAELSEDQAKPRSDPEDDQTRDQRASHLPYPAWVLGLHDQDGN